MNERTMKFWVGLMMLATVLVTAILALLVSELPPLVGGYTIHIQFPAAAGVTRDTPVLNRGIRIGRVSDVRFSPDGSSVLIDAAIEDEHRLFHDEVCYVSSSLVGGDVRLDFLPGRESKPERTPIVAGETIHGQSGQELGQALGGLQEGVSSAMGALYDASHDIQETAKKINGLVDETRPAISQDLTEVRTAMRDFSDVLGRVKDLTGQLHADLAEVQPTIKKMYSAADSMSEMMRSGKDNFENLKGLTEPLRDNGPALLARINGSTAKLDRLADQLLRFSEALNRPDGSLGQLINNPEVYQHLSRALKNVDEITRDLKPVVEDARVFSDKIARHPEVLGVRGALRPSSGLK